MMENSESKYIKKYQDMPWWRRTELYNDVMKVVEYQYCKWYGSAYGVTHSEVRKVVEDIMTGKTTITKYKREFNEQALRQMYGLGPNDPLPETPKRRTKLENYTTEELEAELNKRKTCTTR